MSKHIYQPFTYRIGWSEQDVHYYGVRYGKGAHPTELWTTYFTSSAVVKRLRDSYGEPDVIEVRKTFDNRDDAILWEQRVLQRLNPPQNPRWANQCMAPAFNATQPWNKGLSGISNPNYPKQRKKRPPETEEAKELRRIASKKLWEVRTEEEKAAISKRMKAGRKNKTPWNKGKTGAQTAWNKGVSHPWWTCPHCGKKGQAPGAYSRWHGDNCRIR